ncbi:MAG: GAF domain-containing protein [Magnetococcales bacterium]|nr:GAF domain-containing protein [Magnetococcales bacterium]
MTTNDHHTLDDFSNFSHEALLAELQKTRLALNTAHQKNVESEALLRAAKAIPLSHTFSDSARSIFDTCCELTGARSGYVAMLSEDGQENEVLFLEAGGMPCTVDPNLPMPIRGLRAVCYETNSAVYDNDFFKSDWMRFMPEGHVFLKNVMFAPIVLNDKTVGLIGMANKEGDFTDEDAKIATTFGELASVALRFARYQDQLRRWSHVFEFGQWGVGVVDANTTFMEMMNPAFNRLHGMTDDALIGRPFAEIFTHEERESVVDYLANARANGHHTFESRHVHSDGSTFPVYVDITWVEEPVLESTDGHYDSDNNEETGASVVQYYVINLLDITKRKAAEDAIRRSNEELRQYARVAAHQLKEPLRLIASFTQLLSQRYSKKLDKQAGEYIDYAVSGAKRLQRLLDGLLVYAQVGVPTATSSDVDTRATLNKELTALQETIQQTGANVVINDLPWVHVNPGELRLLFHHLLRNALENSGESPPEITITASEQGKQIKFIISDKGQGIAPRHQSQIFGLFIRLQGPTEGEGTGIGLAICKKVVEHHHGRIWVESEKNQGASFHFTLPSV